MVNTLCELDIFVFYGRSSWVSASAFEFNKVCFACGLVVKTIKFLRLFVSKQGGWLERTFYYLDFSTEDKRRQIYVWNTEISLKTSPRNAENKFKGY